MTQDPIGVVTAYSAALDKCVNDGGASIDEVMEFFADDAVRIQVGGPTQSGKAAIRESFLRRGERYDQSVTLKGIDVWGDLVICRLERRDTTQSAGVTHNVRVFLVKDGKIKQLVVITDPEEFAKLRRQS